MCKNVREEESGTTSDGAASAMGGDVGLGAPRVSEERRGGDCDEAGASRREPQRRRGGTGNGRRRRERRGVTKERRGRGGRAPPIQIGSWGGCGSWGEGLGFGVDREGVKWGGRLGLVGRGPKGGAVACGAVAQWGGVLSPFFSVFFYYFSFISLLFSFKVSINFFL